MCTVAITKISRLCIQTCHLICLLHRLEDTVPGSWFSCENTVYCIWKIRLSFNSNKFEGFLVTRVAFQSWRNTSADGKLLLKVCNWTSDSWLDSGDIHRAYARTKFWATSRAQLDFLSTSVSKGACTRATALTLQYDSLSLPHPCKPNDPIRRCRLNMNMWEFDQRWVSSVRVN